MRRFLLASAAALAILGCQPARAQLPTIDAASITQLMNQLQQMKQDYQVYMGIFGSLLRVVDPNSFSPGLIGQQTLPGFSQISQMVVGGGNMGPLSGLANQFQSANTIYTPQSTGANDFNALYMQRSGNSLSGVQAMAQSSISGIQEHIAGLVVIQQQLSVVKTDTDVAAIQARLQAEQANIAAQGVQSQSLMTMMQAQQQQYELQQMQKQRQDADELLTLVSGGGSGTAMPQMNANTVPTFSGG